MATLEEWKETFRQADESLLEMLREREARRDMKTQQASSQDMIGTTMTSKEAKPQD